MHQASSGGPAVDRPIWYGLALPQLKYPSIHPLLLLMRVMAAETG
jgi:hypothetical protein